MASLNIYPAIPYPTDDANSLRDAVLALKTNVEILTQQRATAESPASASTANTSSSINTYSLLDVLTEAEKTDVLSGANLIDITSKITDWIANAIDGSRLDASMLNGIVTFTADIFSGIHTKAVTFVTGRVNIEMDFNGKSFHIPSYCTWESTVHTHISPNTEISSIAGENSPAASLIETQFVGSGRTCNGTAGSPTLAVSDASGINKGAQLAVFGTKLDFSIAHTLGSGITASSTSITFGESVANTIEGTYGYFRIGGTEIVRGAVIGGVLDMTYSAGGRGKQGTIAASHLAGAAIVPLQSEVHVVTAVSGTNITLTPVLSGGVVNGEFRCGAIDSALRGTFTIDGEYDNSVPPVNVWNCLGATLSVNFKVDGRVRLLRAPTGGLFLFGARDANIDLDRITDCGQPSSNLGGALWMFGHNYENRVHVREMNVNASGVLIDNKSSGITYFGLDQENYNNIVDVDQLIGHTHVGVDVTASHENVVRVGYCDCVDAAIGLFNGTPQQTNALSSIGNYIQIGFDKNQVPPAGDALVGNTLDYVHSGQTTPTATDALGGTFTSTTELNYVRDGRSKTVRFDATITITGVGTASDILILPLPFAPVREFTCIGYSSATGFVLSAKSSGNNLQITEYDGSTCIAVATINVTGTYEISA